MLSQDLIALVLDVSTCVQEVTVYRSRRANFPMCGRVFTDFSGTRAMCRILNPDMPLFLWQIFDDIFYPQKCLQMLGFMFVLDKECPHILVTDIQSHPGGTKHHLMEHR